MNRLLSWVALAATAGVASTMFAERVVTLHFDADVTHAAPGETIVWTVSASWSGFFSPEPFFEGFAGDFLANTSVRGTAGSFEALLDWEAGTTSSDGPNVLGVNILQHPFVGEVDYSNPIDIFRFRVEVESATSGLLWYRASGEAAMGVHWWFDPPRSYVMESSSDSVRIVPGPAGWIGIAGAAALGGRRRRASRA
jgi:hypothetical protein